MSWSIRRLSVAAVAAALIVALTGCPGDSEAAALECLGRSSVTVLSGAQTAKFDPGSAQGADSTVNAIDASWALTEGGVPVDYPFRLRESSGPDVCVVGGAISTTHPHATTPWLTFKQGAGATVQSSGSTFVGTHLSNVGDGFRYGTGDSSDWTLRSVRVDDAHDDCIENDKMHSGLVADSFFAGCWAFYSSRGEPGTNLDGWDETVTIVDSLVYLKPIPMSRHTTNGNSMLFKMGTGVGGVGTGLSPRLAIHDTVFRMDQTHEDGSWLNRFPLPVDHDSDPLTPDESYLASCSNNTIVWTGGGTMPQASTYDPSCFTITDDIDVWNVAVAAWEDAHTP